MGSRYEMGTAKQLDREEELGGNRTQRGRLPQVLRTSANHRNTQRRFRFHRKKSGTKMKPSTVTKKWANGKEWKITLEWRPDEHFGTMLQICNGVFAPAESEKCKIWNWTKAHEQLGHARNDRVTQSYWKRKSKHSRTESIELKLEPNSCTRRNFSLPRGQPSLCRENKINR
jgi:hypothetical protein